MMYNLASLLLIRPATDFSRESLTGAYHRYREHGILTLPAYSISLIAADHPRTLFRCSLRLDATVLLYPGCDSYLVEMGWISPQHCATDMLARGD